VTETSEKTTWLTQEAYHRLKTELDHLAGPGRVDIAKKIEAAREEGIAEEVRGWLAFAAERLGELGVLRAAVGHGPGLIVSLPLFAGGCAALMRGRDPAVAR